MTGWDHIKWGWKKLYDFFDDDLTYYAASLSFYTIFAMIPILLIVLSIFTSFSGFDIYYSQFKEIIFSYVIPANIDMISEYLDGFIANSGNMGEVGVIYILAASVIFFKSYEYIMSMIFEARLRSFWQAVAVYWTLVTLMPIGLALSIYLTGHIQVYLDANRYTSSIHIVTFFPYFITWLLFFVLIMISANKRLHKKSVFISSFVAAFFWSLSKYAFVYYVLYNKAYKSIYGSFSLVLFFFLWIYLSWVIMLYSMKICTILERRQIEKQENETP